MYVVAILRAVSVLISRLYRTANYMFQYFLKVVSTKLITLSGDVLNTHQYSVTEYERDLSQGNKPGKDDHGHQTSYVS